MRWVFVCLIAASFAISWLVTFWMRTLAVRIGFVDKPGGRKIHDNPKPLGGGVGIFWGLALPILLGLAILALPHPPEFLRSSQLLGHEIASNLDAYWSGARLQAPMAWSILLAAVAIHALGLWDDKKALGPMLKLVVQIAIITALVVESKSRVLTFLDQQFSWGETVSFILTVLWIAAVTNAFNFLDNMDGLSAGVAAVCTTAFLIATLSIGQWFVAAGL